MKALVVEGYLFGVGAAVSSLAFILLFLSGENPVVVGGVAVVVLTLIGMLWAVRAPIRKARLEQELREV